MQMRDAESSVFSQVRVAGSTTKSEQTIRWYEFRFAEIKAKEADSHDDTFPRA
jgi:hypothetical protein